MRCIKGDWYIGANKTACYMLASRELVNLPLREADHLGKVFNLFCPSLGAFFNGSFSVSGGSFLDSFLGWIMRSSDVLHCCSQRFFI